MSWTLIVGLFVLFVANAALAYRYRSRQMRARGETPPPFLKYLLVPDFRRRVNVPGGVRVVLGVVVVLGGAAMTLIGAMLVATVPIAERANPFAAAAVIAVFLALALAITYVGIRLLRMKHKDEHLFERNKSNPNGAV